MYREYLESHHWKCHKSPTGAHHWRKQEVRDPWTCIHCGETRIFLTGEEEKVPIGDDDPDPLLSDPRLVRVLRPTFYSLREEWV